MNSQLNRISVLRSKDVTIYRIYRSIFAHVLWTKRVSYAGRDLQYTNRTLEFGRKNDNGKHMRCTCSVLKTTQSNRSLRTTRQFKEICLGIIGVYVRETRRHFHDLCFAWFWKQQLAHGHFSFRIDYFLSLRSRWDPYFGQNWQQRTFVQMNREKLCEDCSPQWVECQSWSRGMVPGGWCLGRGDRCKSKSSATQNGIHPWRLHVPAVPLYYAIPT